MGRSQRNCYSVEPRLAVRCGFSYPHHRCQRGRRCSHDASRRARVGRRDTDRVRKRGGRGGFGSARSRCDCGGTPGAGERADHWCGVVGRRPECVAGGPSRWSLHTRAAWRRECVRHGNVSVAGNRRAGRARRSPHAHLGSTEDLRSRPRVGFRARATARRRSSVDAGRDAARLARAQVRSCSTTSISTSTRMSPSLTRAPATSRFFSRTPLAGIGSSDVSRSARPRKRSPSGSSTTATAPTSSSRIRRRHGHDPGRRRRRSLHPAR